MSNDEREAARRLRQYFLLLQQQLLEQQYDIEYILRASFASGLL